MKRSLQVVFSLALLCFCLQTNILADSHYRYINDLNTEIYFGHISYLDAAEGRGMPLILREGKTAPEAAVLNFPIAPGDTVITPEHARCEIQFDTGTVIRLDSNTELKIETILAQSLSSSFNLTNLVLKKGQVYTIYKQYKPDEVLQLLAPNASVKLKHNTRLMMRANIDGSTDVQVWGGQASVLYGESEQALEQVSVKKSMALTVSSTNTAEFTEYKNSAEFYLWNQDINQNYDQLHEGLTAIPKPIQRLSPAVFNFAQRYSNVFGEWVWNDIYGYVWRPFTNDYYPTGTWQPYYYGQWREINSDLFWVPQESWGWVPYHLGNWIWNKKLGWVWIPGSAFAPAWVDWRFYFGHFAWRPLSLVETYFYGPYWSCYYCNFPAYAYLYDQLVQKLPPDIGDFDSGVSNDVVSAVRSGEGSSGEKKIINKNQLKQRGTEPVKVPKDIRNVLSRLAEVIRNGDMEVLASINEMPGTVVVRAEDLNRPQVYALSEPFENLDRKTQVGLQVRSREENSMSSAVSAFRRNEIVSTVGKNLVLPEPDIREVVSSDKQVSSMPARLSDWKKVPLGKLERLEQSISPDASSRFDRPLPNVKPELRIRDWNPDIRKAARLGVTIDYSSKDNTVRCPDLGLTSRSGNARLGSSSRGVFSQASSSLSGSRSSSSTSSSSSGSSQSTSSSSGSSSSSSSGRSGSSSSSGRGIVKK
jgi:hypothetical protein